MNFVYICKTVVIIIAQGGVQVRVNTCMLVTLQKAHCYISFDEFVACKNFKISLSGLLLCEKLLRCLFFGYVFHERVYIHHFPNEPIPLYC